MKLLEISSELNKVMLLDDILARIYIFFQDVIPYERIGRRYSLQFDLSVNC